MEIEYSPLKGDPNGYRYELNKDYLHYSKTFNRYKTLRKGMKSDGASGARDLGAKESGWRKYWDIGIRHLQKTYLGKWIEVSHGKVTAAWYVHDAFCEEPYWDDGTPISNFIASTIFACILYSDGYKIESIPYWWATFLFGGQKIKKEVGWLWVPTEEEADA